MFRFFRKKKYGSMKDWEFNLLNKIISKLPSEYSFLKKQIDNGFVLGSAENQILGDGWKSIIYNQDLISVYKTSEGNDFKLRRIRVFNHFLNKYQEVELDISEGILIGYKLPDARNYFDLTKIELEYLKKELFQNEELENLQSILGNIDQEIQNQLDVSGTFKIELREGIFYTIKDFEDGNYLGVDLQGAVYGLIHDPYEVEKLFDNKDVFFEKLDSGEFDIEKYYSGKMS